MCQKDIENAFTSANTRTELLSLLGLPKQGSSYLKIKRIATQYGLKLPPKTQGFKLEDVMVPNSTYPRSHLKRRLILGNVIQYECVGCGNDGHWHGKKLSLQLHHKNGVNNDNRVGNLCFMCPNCHSQTDNFAGKNS